jgi:uncharacterized membrane protein
MNEILHLIDRGLVLSHVAAGFIALFFAPLAMAAAKGGVWHRRWGKVWFWGMMAVAFSTFALMFFRFSLFLFVVAILSGYNAITGYRVLYRKQPTKPDQKPNIIDWGAAMIAGMAGAALALYGIAGVTGLLSQAGYTPNGTPTAFFILSIVFGAALALDARSDMQSFTRTPSDKNGWWFYHMTRMLSGYIATVTAFLVQNVGRHLPDAWSWVAWVAPAVVGTVLISIWVAHYKRKFAAQNKRVSAAAHA